ncbi:MAG: hypothetical protein LBD42_01050 [Desulfovibrio sp.]|jgi:hypothetical protein|nr:hypothetical protein [Desulfovibrio sp.]
MKLFRLPKRDPGRFAEDTPLLKIVRYILIILLFGGVGLGVWLNGQKRAALRAKPVPELIDKRGSLPECPRNITPDDAGGFCEGCGIFAAVARQDHADA